MKKFRFVLLLVAIFVSTIPSVNAATICFPHQGCTGKGVAVPGDVGKFLQVTDDSPFTYSFTDASTLFASTLASVSGFSTDATKSLYTMTSTIPVEFRSSDGNPILYLDETNERIGIGTNAPSDSLSLSGNSATRIGTTWLNTNSSPSTSAFLGAYSGNMQMGTVSNHPFYLETNNTVRISIAAAGNIGIGLNSGSAKLHVLATTEQLRLGYDASNYASFTVTSGGLLNIAPTGTNVGINVASPSSPLHVNGAIRSQRTGTATQNIVLDGGDSSAIYLTASSTTGGQKILRFRNLVTGGAATDATNQFAWDLNTDSSILQIATLSFGSGFKVNRSNTTTQFLSVNGGDSSGIYLTGQSATSAEKILYISNFTNGTATSANGMRFRVGDVGTPVTAATIDYLGNVGIGVTPTHRLDAYLSSSSTGVSTIYGLRDIPSGTISSGSSINGIFGQVTVSGSSTISNVIPTAGRFIAEHDGSSTVGGVYGVYAHARTNAASTGVLANAYSLYAVAPNNNQAGNTITNAYSLYIESPTAGTALNYGLFQTGTAINQFGGNVGIGISPTAVLHLKAGTATASTAPLKFTTGTLNTTAEAGAMEFLAERFYLTPTSTARQVISGALFTQTADTTVANTVTETTLVGTGVGTMTLPANFFVAGKTLRLTWRGILSDTATPTVRIRVKLGSTVIGDTGAVALTGTVTNEEWVVDYILTSRTTGATGTVFGQGSFHFDNATSSGLTFGMPSTAATTIDTTASQVVSVTIEWGAADAANTITSTNGILEVLN